MRLNLESQGGQLRLLGGGLSQAGADLLTAQVVAGDHDGAEGGPGHDGVEEGDVGGGEIAQIEEALVRQLMIFGQVPEIGGVQLGVDEADTQSQDRGPPEPGQGSRLGQAPQDQPHPQGQGDPR
ncbi:hypothetical protein D3C86_1255080 [compost metagenome]